jgi:hypothetical protein
MVLLQLKLGIFHIRKLYYHVIILFLIGLMITSLIVVQFSHSDFVQVGFHEERVIFKCELPIPVLDITEMTIHTPLR